jgi:hypothetical protein
MGLVGLERLIELVEGGISMASSDLGPSIAHHSLCLHHISSRSSNKCNSHYICDKGVQILLVVSEDSTKLNLSSMLGIILRLNVPLSSVALRVMRE